MMCYTTVNTSLSLIPNLLNINTFVIEDIYEGNSYFCKFCSVFSTDAFILKNKLDWLTHGVVQLQYDYSHGIVPKVASRNKLIWVQYLCWDEVTASYKLDNRLCNELSPHQEHRGRCVTRYPIPFPLLWKRSCTRFTTTSMFCML